jgi:hypothetical protein
MNQKLCEICAAVRCVFPNKFIKNHFGTRIQILHNDYKFGPNFLFLCQNHLIVNSTQCNENILTLCEHNWNENFCYIPSHHSCFHINDIGMEGLSIYVGGFYHNVSGITASQYIYEILPDL